jgi:hypothetical protein
MSILSAARIAALSSTIGLQAVLAACAGAATPRMIGAYPMPGPTPVATYVPPSASTLLTCDGFIRLQVAHVPTAADEIMALTDAFNGYLASQEAWFEGDLQHISLTLAIPAPKFDALHAAVLPLGHIQDERLTPKHIAVPPGGSPWNTFTHLTVHLVAAPPPSGWSEPVRAVPEPGWSPARTFARAFGVFAALFTFLADVLIWVSVVVGPFILLGFGLRWLMRQARRPAPPPDNL